MTTLCANTSARRGLCRGAALAAILLAAQFLLCPRLASAGGLQLRYPDGRQTTTPPPPTVTDQGSTLVVTSERARLVFSKQSASVTGATLMGRQIPLVSIPDALVVSSAGLSYRQRSATDGTLQVDTPPSDKYIRLSGSCTPRGDWGPGPVRIDITYDIHRVTGFTIINVTVWPNAGAKIREFAMEHALGPNATQTFPWLQYMSNGLLADVSVPSTSPGVIMADTLPFALWSNGATGLEVTSISYQNSVIDSAYMGTGWRHYMTVGTHSDGSRAIDMVFVKVRPGSEVMLQSGITYTYALSFLPWRKFRPLYELYTGRFDVAVNQSGTNPDPAITAREGITTAFDWDFFFSYPNLYTLQNELVWTAKTNQHGMQQMRYVDHQLFKPLFVSPSDPAWDRLTNWKIWYPQDQVRQDLIQNRWTARDFPQSYDPNGICYTCWPNDPNGYVRICINGQRAQDFFYDQIREWIDMAPSGLVYIDDFTPLICSNAQHGCSSYGKSMSIGDHQLVERLHDLFQSYDPKIRLFLHMQNIFNNSVSLADYQNPGEQGPAGIPARPELNIIYNPFLRGTQIIWYTASFLNKRNNDIRTYESALSMCGLVLHNWTYTPLTEEQKQWFAKYLCPLDIYDVEHSTVRHPLEPEYPDYAQAETDLITPVIYERAGDALLVVVKNGDTCDPKPVTLSTAPLGLTGDRVLVFDTVARQGSLKPVQAGKIVLGPLPVNNGPQIFRIMNIRAAPFVVWHDQVAWRVMGTSSSSASGVQTWQFQMCGVPNSESMVYIHCPIRPSDTAALVSWDAASNIATCKVAFDSGGLGSLSLTLQSTSGATTVADMAGDWSSAQGANGWWYLRWINTGGAYDPAAVEELDRINAGLWMKGGGGMPHGYAGIYGPPGVGAYPNGMNAHGELNDYSVPVRRWVSNCAGKVTISGHVKEFDQSVPANQHTNGGYARIYVDGGLAHEEVIAPNDFVGRGYSFDTTLSVGSRVDFTFDPKGPQPFYPGEELGWLLTEVYGKIDFVIEPSPGFGALRASIELLDFDGDLSLAPVRIQTFQGASLVRSDEVILNQNPGEYIINNLPPGTYDLKFACSKFLRKNLPGLVVTSDAITPCSVSLANGDADADNEVTSTDPSVVLKNMGRTGD